jgi:acetolactate synthase I/III small subunit
MSTKHTIVALVEDRPGVLNRMASKWRQRGFNIESLAVGHSEIAGLSRMTFVVDAATTDVEQVVKQVDKLIDVIRIEDITDSPLVARELALVKVRTTAANRSEIIQIVDIFRANIVDVTANSVIVEVTGDEDKVESLLQLLQEYGIVELCRTGKVAMPRGSNGVTLGLEERDEILLPHLEGDRAPGGIY